MASLAVSVAGVDKRFGAVEVLHDIGLEVEAGAVVALLGPSGCGKTTLLRIIAGLERPDAGRVLISGRTVAGDGAWVPPEKRRVGMVFQDWALFPHMTVERNVGYGIAKRDADRASRIAEALELVGLTGLGDRMPGTLSGGQQQRVALARALAPRPSVLLLDEPFSNLDTALRVQVRAEVHALLAELGVTSVFVTHDQDEAFVLGDHVAVMSAGRIVQAAPPAELYARPANPWVATFVGEANLVDGDATGERADTPVGAVPLAVAAAGPVQVLVRPEALRLAPGDGATVELTEYYGHDTLYVVRTDGGVKLRARAGAAPTVARGDRVSLRYEGPPTMAFEPVDHPGADRRVIVVVGAGPAGLAAAWYAARAGHEVTVVDRAPHVGGMAASREVAGLRVDLGSHRLHPATPPELLADLRDLLGDDLQERPRNGRIRLAGRWVGFPLRTGDLVRNLPVRFAAGAAADALAGPLRRARDDTFGAQLRKGLGSTVVDEFYGPYARKLWATDAADLAGELARKRVSASSPLAVARKLVRGASADGRVFLYPRRGFGQLSEAIGEAAVDAGARLRLGTGVAGIDLDRPAVTLDDGSVLAATTVISTMPVTALSAMAGGPTAALRHRAMVVVWLVLDRPRWTPFDAHYLPDPSHPVARVSEPKNYRDSSDDPVGTTVLCAEVPCWEDDDLWRASPEQLGQVVADALVAEGLPAPGHVAVEVERLPRVYPLYTPGFAWELARIEAWLAEAAGTRVVTLGRQGLFVPDNTHHVLGMGRSAAACLRSDGTLDRNRWRSERAAFRQFVVED